MESTEANNDSTANDLSHLTRSGKQLELSMRKSDDFSQYDAELVNFGKTLQSWVT